MSRSAIAGATDDQARTEAKKHAERIRVEGLEFERLELIQRLSRTLDINDALEIRHRLDKIELMEVEAFGVLRHLEAAGAVQPPSPTMVHALQSLLSALAGFQWQTERLISLVEFARQTTREFGAELSKTRALGT